MSIVEKVISRDSKSKQLAESGAVTSNNDQVNSVQLDDRTRSDAISLSNLGHRGLISVLDDVHLSRAFRFIKRSILAKIFGPSGNKEQDSGKVIMITSAMPHAGKSFVAFNLAVSIAQEELINVILIDADTVRHKLSTALGVRDEHGLLEMLTARNMGAGAVPTELPGLRFIPTGESHDNATELLASAYMKDILDKLTDKDTVVVVDTTPLLVSSEADAIGTHADHTIVVVESGNTSIDEIESSLQVLQKSGSAVCFLMNKLKSLGHSGAPDYYYEVY